MIEVQEHKDHYKSIIQLVFGSDSDYISIDIFDKETVPSDYFEIIQNAKCESLIVLNVNTKIKDINENIEKLSKILSKQINCIKNSISSRFYWFEGLQEISCKDKLQSDFNNTCSFERIKSETRLPYWLDKYIFEILKASYAPDFEKFDYNLEHSEEELLIYLGTYFPRSYAESFCIFEDLLCNSYYSKILKDHNEINIFDIGCGTGGNLIGLLIALDKHLSSGYTVNIYAVDGNEDALGILFDLIKMFELQSNLTVNFNSFSSKISNIQDLNVLIKELPYSSFDIIMSFKTINEFILKGEGSCNNAYNEFLELVCPMLSNIGLVLLLDVTTKTQFTDYMPILLNEQARKYLKLHSEYKILSPLSCNSYSDSCNNYCFYQHDFLVSHQQKTNDISRVAYKIVGQKDFIKDIIKDVQKGRYVVNWKHIYNPLKNNGCCPNSTHESNYIDAYKISN